MLKWFKFNKKADELAERQQENNMYKAVQRNILDKWLVEEKHCTDQGLPLLPDGFCWEISPVFDLAMLDEPYRYVSILGPESDGEYNDRQLHCFKLYAEERYSTPEKVKEEVFMFMNELHFKAKADLLTGHYPPKTFPEV